jgi:hypothetical protein
VKTIAGAAVRQGSDDFLENTTVGLFVQQQLAWRNRVFVTAALRGDDNSAFGENYDFVTYPKLSATWVVSEEPMWRVPAVSTLKLRAAYGASGKQPDAFAAVRTFASRPGPGGTAAVTPQSIGNPDLGPERGTELELGFDIGLLTDRLAGGLTYFDNRRPTRSCCARPRRRWASRARSSSTPARSPAAASSCSSTGGCSTAGAWRWTSPRRSPPTGARSPASARSRSSAAAR